MYFQVSFESSWADPPHSWCYINGVHGGQEKYYFNHFHLHWGKTSADGSEHTIDDKRYPMEVISNLIRDYKNISLFWSCLLGLLGLGPSV